MTPNPVFTTLDREIDPANAIAVVVGSHPRAEVGDRPAAYGLQRELASALRATGSGLEPIVLSDLWYLNDAQLRAGPTVSVGAPDVNALSAHLADRVPSAYVIDDTLMVQMDVDGGDPVACCWGVRASETARSVGVFCERYLDLFVRAAMARGAAA
ncbi:MAG: hypothetical protein DHS20C14_06500 [Phycisphaeraceae bacterium]|nr:MAG: hypothetical protein DHS20C14_06500 [Phycisphaeraceae bacterium]